MNLTDAIDAIDQAVVDPQQGLPEQVFRLASRLVPMVNVDLLVHDAKGRVLLAWRHDEFNPPGWHIPGGIVRYKERLEERVQKVAQAELGTPVTFDPEPVALHQFFKPHATRGHFLSLLYRCEVADGFEPDNVGRPATEPGFLKWHDAPPDNLITTHDVYRKYL